MKKIKQIGLRMGLFGLSLGILGLISPAAMAATIFVNHAASGANDGTSWANAYTSLTTAITAASASDDIWVAQGTYTPGATRVSTFSLKGNVDIYGGFAGTETLLSERDWMLNRTVLSGDIGTIGTPTDNVYHVVTGVYLGVLDGFWVTDGYVDGTNPDNRGGGITNTVANVTIRNCVFTHNYGQYGGALFTSAGSITIEDCIFTANTSEYGGGTYHIGGDPTYTRCIIAGNESLHTAGGTGILGGSTGNFHNTVWVGNKVTDAVGDGGAFSIGGATATITASIFAACNAYRGGGIYTYSTGTANIHNSIVWNNSATNGMEFSNEGITPTFSYSKIKNGINGSGFEGAATDGGNNIAGVAPFVPQPASSTWTSNAVFNNANYSTTFTDTGATIFDGQYKGAFLKPTTGDDRHYLIIDNTNNTFTVIGDASALGTSGNTYTIVDLHPDPSSDIIDAGNAANHPGTDFHTNTPYDHTTGDTGAGTPTYTDIGPYEYVPSTVSFSAASSATTSEANGNHLVDIVVAVPGGRVTPRPIVMDVTNAGGTATSGSDYNAFSIISVTLPPAMPNGTIKSAAIFVLDDNASEGNETIDVSLSVSAGDAVASGITAHQVTITDDEAASGTTRYVSTSGNDNNDGSTPALAFDTIQAAIDASATGDTILVYPGRYTGAGNVNLDFTGKDITLQGLHGARATIIDCQSQANTRAFTFNSGETNSAKVSGFTLTGGSATSGAAIYLSGSSPTLSCLIITNNTASQYGGGIYASSSNSLIEACRITGGRAMAGAGIMIDGTSTVSIKNSVLDNNSASVDGGAIWDATRSSRLTLKHCTIANNSAASRGGGLGTDATQPTEIYNSIISGNTAATGAQILDLAGRTTAETSIIEGGFGGVDIRDVNPRFADATNGGFHLDQTSPAIDSADSRHAAVYDFNGVPRDRGNSVADLGAFEYYDSSHGLRLRGSTDGRDYQMIGLSGHFDDEAIMTRLATHLGTYDINTWRLYRYSDSRYAEGTAIDGVTNAGMNPGSGFWLLSRFDITIPFARPINHCRYIEVPLTPGWNMISNPFMVDIDTSHLQVRTASSAYTGINAQSSGVVNTSVFHYSNRSYNAVTTMPALGAVWVQNLTNTTAYLLVPPPQ